MEYNNFDMTHIAEQGNEETAEQNTGIDQKLPQADFDSYGFYPDSGF